MRESITPEAMAELSAAFVNWGKVQPVSALFGSERPGMDILGIGTEIVECLRIGKMIEQHGELFLRRVYTPREIRHCQNKTHATEHFAAFWAAKEAVLKALNAERARGIRRTDLEIRIDPSGRPRVFVCGAPRETVIALGVRDILVSLAHCRTSATAYALAIGQPGSVPPRAEEELPGS